MSEPEGPLQLAARFPAATREDWRKLVDAVRKGAPFEQLAGTTYDGLAIEPLAPRATDARPIAARAAAAPWQVLARIDHPDPALANAAARHELDNGATGLSLVFAGAVGDYGFGLPAREDTLGRVLEDIDTSAITIDLALSPAAEAAVDAALARGLLPLSRAKRVCLGHDPLGAMALGGMTVRPWNKAAPHFARRLAALARNGFSEQKLAVADGRIIHNAGGSEAQELAFVLAVGIAYLRALESEGVALDQARRMIFFRLAADADQFLSIAKFRSLRKLWARIEDACALTPAPAFISAETAWRMLTRRDPYVNILRNTIAVAAAGLSGADAITVVPHTAALGLPDDSARRIARNIQLLLLEESNLARVGDPAAGSGALETLTAQLCAAAWTLFQEIERAGGIADALERGLLQQKVATVCAERMAAVARRKDPLTGVSIFPDLQEKAPATALPRATAADGLAAPSPLSPIRIAESFEALRDASDQIRSRSGARPKIFLACLGGQADFTSRATFAANLFEAGGIEAVTGTGDAAALGAAFKASGAALACLCGSDSAYEAEAEKTAAALKAAGTQHLYFAGRAGAREAAWRASGVQSFIDDGSDALATLRAAYDIIGRQERTPG